MTRRPSFQFYPADWLGSTNLRRCTHEEKGAWMDTLCSMHDSPTEYGILRWPLKEIAQAVHCKVAVLESLTKKGVLKGADPGEMCPAFIFTPRHARKDGEPVVLIQAQPGPLWYSSRMVVDEYVRSIRGESSRFKAGLDECAEDAPIPPPNHAPKPPFGDGSSSSSSSSSVDSSLRSNLENPSPGKSILGLNVDPVLLVLPCQKGKLYHVTQGKLNQWGKAYPELDPLAEARKMLLWLEENPTRMKTFGGMGRFVTTWLSNAMVRVNERKAKAGPWNKQVASDYLEQNREFFERVNDVPA